MLHRNKCSLLFHTHPSQLAQLCDKQTNVTFFLHGNMDCCKSLRCKSRIKILIQSKNHWDKKLFQHQNDKEQIRWQSVCKTDLQFLFLHSLTSIYLYTFLKNPVLFAVIQKGTVLYMLCNSQKWVRITVAPFHTASVIFPFLYFKTLWTWLHNCLYYSQIIWNNFIMCFFVIWWWNKMDLMLFTNRICRQRRGSVLCSSLSCSL